MNFEKNENSLTWSDNGFSYTATNRDSGFTIVKTILKQSNDYVAIKKELEQEYEINRNLIKEVEISTDETELYYSISYSSDTLCLLDKYFKSHQIHDITNIFQRICLELYNLHNSRSIMYGISPYSVAINPDTNEIEFFQQQWISSQFSTLHPHYLAPEQTRLIERPIDLRCDLYSLGLCFFSYLQNDLPFETNNKEKLFREIVTKKIFVINHSDHPEYLVYIINKLLSKLSQNRYQNAYSIYYDLNLKDTLKKETIAQLDFLDIKGTQTIESLNNKAITELDKIVEMCKNGYLGIIKLQSDPLHQPYKFIFKYLFNLNNKNIYSLIRITSEGHKSVPFLSISLLLKEYAYFMSYSEIFKKEEIAQFFNKLPPILMKSLVLLCKDFASFITKEISLKNFRLSDSNTVYIAVKKLTNFILSISSPIIIYIEKIENLDFDSFKLLLEIYKDETMGKLLFMYTTEKQFDFSNFTTSEKAILKTISLESITETELNNFVFNQFNANFEKQELFTKNVYDKSGGSPAICYDIINNILERKQLFYNITTKKWMWDREYFTFPPINFEEWIYSRINEFSKELQTILTLGSISGEFFDIVTISQTLHISTQQITKHCWIAEKHGFIVHSCQNSINNRENKQIIYRFTTLKIPKIIKKRFAELYRPHLNTFKSHLLRQANIFNSFILFHDFFQKFSNDFTHEEDVDTFKLSEYFYNLSFRFFALNKIKEAQFTITLAKNFLGKNSWTDKYDYTEELYFLALKIAVEYKDHKSLNSIQNEIIPNIKKTSKLLELNINLIEFYLEHGLKTKVNQLIKQCFKSIHSPLPEKMLFVEDAKIFMKELFFNNKILNKELHFTNKPLSEKEYFTIELIKQYFKKRDKSFIYSFQKLFVPLIKNGIHERHVIVLLYYALYLFEKGKNIQVAKQLTKTVVNKQLTNKELEIEKLLFYETKLLVYTENIKSSKSKLQEEIISNIDIGNYSDAYYYTFNYFFLLIFNGENLNSIILKVKEYIERPSQKIRNNIYYELIKVFLKNFDGLTKNNMPFFIDIETVKPTKELMFWNFLTKSFIYYLTENHSESNNYLKSAQFSTPNTMKGLPTTILNYFSILSMLQTNKNAIEEQKIETLRKAVYFANHFSPIAKEASYNFGHTHSYLQGSIEMCKAQYKQAILHFNKGIAYAHKNNNILFLALCNKSLSQCYDIMNKKEECKKAIVMSYNYFNLWGAKAIANKIKKRNKILFDEMEQRLTISI